MPYNIDPVCPGEGIAEITWTRPNGSLGKSLIGDDYRVIKEQGMCWNTRYFYYFLLTATSNPYNPRQNLMPNYVRKIYVENKIFLGEWGTPQEIPYPKSDFGGNVHNLTKWFQIVLNHQDGSKVTVSVSPTGTGDYFALPGTITYSHAERVDGTIDNCGKKYVIEVLRYEYVVYRELLGTTPPVVTYKCLEGEKSCPSDTCQVDCGAYYCCYGTDGYAVTNFAK